MKLFRPRTLLLWAALFASACATDSCSCTGFEPREFPANKIDVTIPAVGQARITPAGLKFVEGQIPNLLTQVMPDGLSFCIPEDTSGNPDICVDSTCTNGSPGCQVDLTLDEQSIIAVPSDTIEIDVLIGDVNERLNFDYRTFLGTVNCYVQLFKKGESESTAATVGGKAPIRVYVDQASPMREVGVDVGEVTVDLDDVDFKIHGRGGGGDTIACEGASLVRGLFRGMIEDEVKKALTNAVTNVRRAQLCRACADGCPNGATCAEDGVCDYSPEQCAPRTLGIEGRLDVAGLVGGYVREPNARLDAVAKAADVARVDAGVTVGLRAGFEPVGISDCVPVDPTARPAIRPVNLSPTLSGDARPGGGSFMFGVGLHRSAIEQALWSIWASGGTCLEVSDQNVMILTTTAFSLVAPSMKDLALNGKSAVLAVVSNDFPTVEFGANTVTAAGDTYTIDDPLMKIIWPNVDFHVFTYAQDRMTRMFTLRLDLEIPVAVVADGMGQLVPVIPDLEDAIVRIEPRRLELLSEDANTISDVVPTLLGLAAPQLAGAIPEAIQLPEFLGFRVDLQDRDVTSIDGGEFIAVFANLVQSGAPTGFVANTAILSSEVSYENVLPSGFVRPEVRLDVRALSTNLSQAERREYEYSWRVDGGFWSLYRRSNELVIDDPVLAVQGEHLVEVRARVVGAAATTDPEPARLTVMIDYQDPSVDARTTAEALILEGHDLADEELEYRVIDELGHSTEWSTRTHVPLDGLSVSGRATVEARDDSGRTASRPVLLPPAKQPLKKSGCSTTGGTATLFPLLLFGVVCVRVRRRRRLLQGFAALLFVVTAACGGCKGDLQTNAAEQCFGPECNVDQDCTADSDCSGICPSGNGGICESGQCMCVRACDPGCAEDAFCCLSSEECVEYGDLCAKDDSCDPGYESVVASVSPNRETCMLEDVVCECQPLPPISVGWHGEYASIDTAEGLTVVAAYNKAYGDLMVGRVQPDASIEWHYVDGTPESGIPEGDPNGPRGGITDKAEKVGTHTAIVISSADTAHVFYRDEDNDALKWGRVTFGGAEVEFDSATVDTDGSPGFWTGAALASGAIHVLYAATDAAAGSELRHLQLDANAAPSASASPTVLIAEPAVEQGKGFPIVAASFIDLTVTNNTPFAVFYNGVSDRVGRMQFAAGAWTEPVYVAVGTGPYASGALGTDGLEHVAFSLSTGLRYSRFGDTATSLISDGMRLFAEEYWKGDIGEDSSLRLDGSAITVAYQDAFDRSLIVAKSTDGTTWTSETRSIDGAGSGFWIAMTRRGDAWVADMVVDRREDPVAYLRVTKND